MSLLNKASLIQIPSGYKDGTLYSAKPTNGDGDFTFSRGSNLAATRVNSDGLIEKGRENLLLQSNQFDTTWTTARLSSLTSGQSGYDGSNDAWSVVPNTANDDHKIYQSVSQTGVITFSVYAKANGYNGLALVSSNTNNGKFFNLSNGTLGNDFNSSPIDSTITEIGNGWYRCEVVFNVSAGNFFTIYVSSDGTSTYSFSGNETDGILIQSAQLEQGLVATNVIQTGASTAQAGILEDMPRLDYSGGATCPSLLLEPQRTNIVTQSEALSLISATNSTITQNENVSPEGNQNGSLWTADVVTNGTVECQEQYSTSSGTVYTESWFVKYSGQQFVQLVTTSATFGAKYGNFDLINGIKGNGNFTDFAIEQYANDWYRILATATATSTGTGRLAGLRFISSLTAPRGGTVTTDGSQSIEIYGHQVEAGSYSTSLIPTYGASVTRGNDGFGLSNLPSFSNNTEFSIYLELTRTAVDTGQIGQHYYFYSVSPTAFNFWLHVDAPTAQIRFRDALSSNATMSTIPFDADETKKIIVKSDGTNFKTFADGTLISTYAMPTAFQVEYFTYVVKTFNLNEFLAFPTALSDDECEQLTTI